MAGATHYPKASRHYSTTYPGVDMGGVSKLLVHSTEGSGWPGYDGGAKRPTLTYHPKLREWREHGRLDYSARALQDKTSTPVRENRDRVVQVEIIGTCDPVTHKAHPDWAYTPELTDANLDDLAELLAFLHTEWSVPLVAAPLWLPYPASYGATKARMSSATYDAFQGLLAHQHASGNDHGDCLLNAAGIVSRAKVLTAPKPTPQPVQPPTAAGGEDTDMKLVSYGGKVYIISGLMRRYVPGTPGLLADLVKAYGPVRSISLAEMGMYTPLDTVLAIQGGVAKNVGLALSGQAAIAADLDDIQDDLADDVPAGPEGASA
jgi:hypothetical protein